MTANVEMCAHSFHVLGKYHAHASQQNCLRIIEKQIAPGPREKSISKHTHLQTHSHIYAQADKIKQGIILYLAHIVNDSQGSAV